MVNIKACLLLWVIDSKQTTSPGLSLKIIRKDNRQTTKQDREAQWTKVKDNCSWHSGIDYRLHPELYRVGKGEQGVLICKPYKSEIGQH